MKSTGGKVDGRKRPGGRTAETTAKVNAAVIDLLSQEGVETCTIPNVAAKAGVERSTLYRRYPDRWAMIIDAITEKAEDQVTSSDQGSFKLDLAAVLRKLAALLETPLGVPLMTIAALVKGGAAPGHGDRFWTARVEQLKPMFESAVTCGELRPDVDVEEAFALAAGPVYFRTFISRTRVDEAFIQAIVEYVYTRYSTG